MSTDLDILGTQLQNNIYLHLIAITILYYDHFITLEAEISLLWKRPNTLSSYLFFLNRYFSFFGNICVLVSIFVSTSCGAWHIYQELFHALAQVIVAVLLSLRIYALYDCNKRLLILLSVLILGGIGLAIATDLSASSTKLPSSIPIAGCHDTLDLKNAALVAVGWEAIFIYDVFLFGMTLWKAYQARYRTAMQRFRGMSLLSVVIRDGTIYFGIMAMCNFVNVLTYYVTGNSFTRGSFSPIASCIAVTLMSRLMLRLHEIANQGLYIGHTRAMASFSDTEEYSMTFTTLWSSTTGDDGYAGSQPESSRMGMSSDTAPRPRTHA
jgi:hypothetical protein